jgi:hypothetical protein
VGNLHSQVLVLRFLSQADATPVIEKHHRLHDVNQDNVTRIPVQQYQLDYYKHGEIKLVNMIFVKKTS